MKNRDWTIIGGIAAIIVVGVVAWAYTTDRLPGYFTPIQDKVEQLKGSASAKVDDKKSDAKASVADKKSDAKAAVVTKAPKATKLAQTLTSKPVSTSAPAEEPTEPNFVPCPSNPGMPCN